MIRNPILPGFNPDPSICRVGENYYIAISTFEWFPGVQIHHPGDLVNWRLVRRPLERVSQLDLGREPDSCGVWVRPVSPTPTASSGSSIPTSTASTETSSRVRGLGRRNIGRLPVFRLRRARRLKARPMGALRCPKMTRSPKTKQDRRRGGQPQSRAELASGRADLTPTATRPHRERRVRARRHDVNRGVYAETSARPEPRGDSAAAWSSRMRESASRRLTFIVKDQNLSMP